MPHVHESIDGQVRHTVRIVPTHDHQAALRLSASA
jgi:hypothetical protein